MDKFDTDAIHCTVHEFYARKVYPILNKLLKVLRDKELYKGQWISVWKLLREMGFR